jgi:hypothetical protein
VPPAVPADQVANREHPQEMRVQFTRSGSDQPARARQVRSYFLVSQPVTSAAVRRREDFQEVIDNRLISGLAEAT